jgi:hypothetical protein
LLHRYVFIKYQLKTFLTALHNTNARGPHHRPLTTTSTLSHPNARRPHHWPITTTSPSPPPPHHHHLHPLASKRKTAASLAHHHHQPITTTASSPPPPPSRMQMREGRVTSPSPSPAHHHHQPTTHHLRPLASKRETPAPSPPPAPSPLQGTFGTNEHNSSTTPLSRQMRDSGAIFIFIFLILFFCYNNLSPPRALAGCHVKFV